ncbi:MAG: hypothetical protein ACE5K3_08380 [bacterium]
MPKEKINAEVLNKLEEDLRSKMIQIQKMLKDLQEQVLKSPEEQLKKISEVKGAADVAKAVGEMQREIEEKRKVVETTLKDLQREVDSLKSLKEKAEEEDVTDALKSIALSMRDKKQSLEKIIQELEELKGEYTKRFFR